MSGQDLASALGADLAELQTRDSLTEVSVAVLDSGIDATHPALANRVGAAWRPVPRDGRVDIEPQEQGNHDAFGHGTAVGSIIAKIAKNARLVDYAVLGSDNAGVGDALCTALAHAIDAGHRVINMSLAAKADFGPRLLPLCDKAYRRGQIIVAAKRNMPLCDLGFPAEIATVVSVDRDKFPSQLKIRYQANHVIEFVGHGDEVLCAAPGGLYTTKTGTSFATPALSGCVALILGAFPNLRPFEVKSVLYALADKEEEEAPAA